MKVLVVDDSSTIRLFIKSILLKENYKIVEASSGEEAIKIFQNEDFDLITMDVEMEGSDGYQTCQSIRKIEDARYKNLISITPILFITSNDTVEGRIKGFESGATDFITKPFTKQELLNSIQNIFYPQNQISGSMILIVEDSTIARSVITRLLREQGASVIEAENGKIALEIIRKEAEKIDLILTDFFMPEMNGDELCLFIRNKLGLRNIPVIFLTSASEHDSVLKVFKVGGTDYIVKPFVKEELIARLNVHLNNVILNKSLEKKVLDLKNLDKMKDNLMAVCSHDLRSPLTGILGFSELLLMEESFNEEQIEQLHYINSSGQFLLNLINELLDTANIQFDKDLDMTNIFLNQLIKQSINTLKVNADGKNIQLSFIELDSNLYSILGNYNALLRAFNNLISNAIKFTNKKGFVKVTLGKSNESFYFVSIEDNGLGIPVEKISSIFNKFSKSSRKGTSGEKGTGLGLSISKELIEKHGGSIEVMSEEGKGTTFIVSLPVR